MAPALVSDPTVSSTCMDLPPIRRALINVDLQVDFISGSLPVPSAADIIGPVNELARSRLFELVVYSQDLHPEDHISFVDNAPAYVGREAEVGDIIRFSSQRHGLIRQQLWPRHCVRNTEGAQPWPE